MACSIHCMSDYIISAKANFSGNFDSLWTVRVWCPQYSEEGRLLGRKAEVKTESATREYADKLISTLVEIYGKAE